MLKDELSDDAIQWNPLSQSGWRMTCPRRDVQTNREERELVKGYFLQPVSITSTMFHLGDVSYYYHTAYFGTYLITFNFDRQAEVKKKSKIAK